MLFFVPPFLLICCFGSERFPNCYSVSIFFLLPKIGNLTWRQYNLPSGHFLQRSYSFALTGLPWHQSSILCMGYIFGLSALNFEVLVMVILRATGSMCQMSYWKHKTEAYNITMLQACILLDYVLLCCAWHQVFFSCVFPCFQRPSFSVLELWFIQIFRGLYLMSTE